MPSRVIMGFSSGCESVGNFLRYGKGQALGVLVVDDVSVPAYNVNLLFRRQGEFLTDFLQKTDVAVNHHHGVVFRVKDVINHSDDRKHIGAVQIGGNEIGQ